MPKESRLPGEGNAQRLKMLYLRDIFLKYTNENQSLTRQQIEEKLEDWRGKYICVANVHTTVTAHEDPD